MPRDDRARMAVVARLGEVRDDVGFAKRAHRLQRHQFRIAGPDADAQ